MTDGPAHRYPPPGAPPPEDAPPPAAAPPPDPATGPPHPAHSPYPAPSPSAPYPTYPTHGQQPGAPYAGMLGAAHKPGAIPLRPLTLGSIYDGAFRIIRFNPGATVGAAVLVTAIANLVPVVVTAVLQLATGLSLDSGLETDPGATSAELTVGDALAVLGIVGSLLGGLVATWFGIVFVTGMIAHVTHAAALGRRLTLRDAWAATRGKRWRLVGLNLVVSLGWLLATAAYVALWVGVVTAVPEALPIVLFAVVSVPAYLCAMFWYWIRIYYLPVAALMLEPVGVFGAIGRGYRLTARQFWRTFGIALLTYLVTAVASYALTTPISLVGQFAALAVPAAGWLILVVANAVATVIQYAFIAPFTASVTALQYLDQRMRKEAYDVELMTEAGLVAR